MFNQKMESFSYILLEIDLGKMRLGFIHQWGDDPMHVPVTPQLIYPWQLDTSVSVLNTFISHLIMGSRTMHVQYKK